MSDSARPHRWQPTRLRRPWDSPGKNTGVGCHFLLQCMKVKHESEVAQLCPTLHDPMGCSLPGSSVHGIFQARALEWGAIAFFSLSLQPRASLFSCRPGNGTPRLGFQVHPCSHLLPCCVGLQAAPGSPVCSTFCFVHRVPRTVQPAGQRGLLAPLRQRFSSERSLQQHSKRASPASCLAECVRVPSHSWCRLVCVTAFLCSHVEPNH